MDAPAPGYAMPEAADAMMAAPVAASDRGDIAEPEASPARSLRAPDAAAPGAPVEAEPQAAERLVHYNGYARVRALLPEEAVKSATAACEAAGGYVENLAGSTVTLRVPVAAFGSVFDAILALGVVLDRSTTAQDVTESFRAVDLRLKTLRASRDRLVELLAAAKNETEKLALLREIDRLTQEIDQLALQLETLRSLASYSRITAVFEPHRPPAPNAGPEPIAALRWIRSLSPFRRDVAQSGDYLQLRAPEGMVAIDDREHWLAESADGAVIWSSRRDNEPRGDAAFWLAAVRHRWERQYAEAEAKRIGDYDVLRLVDAEGYRYLIALRVDGDTLDVVEIYYPSAAHEERHGAHVAASLAGGAS